jgi:potassium/chloride transporter 8
MLVVAVVTLTFIMTGQINTLAPIVTMPFLLTYACMDYAYFALAQTFDLRHSREQRFSAQSPSNDRNYGTSDRNLLVENENDLDYLFPERTRHKNLIVKKFNIYMCNI